MVVAQQKLSKITIHVDKDFFTSHSAKGCGKQDQVLHSLLLNRCRMKELSDCFSSMPHLSKVLMGLHVGACHRCQIKLPMYDTKIAFLTECIIYCIACVPLLDHGGVVRRALSRIVSKYDVKSTASLSQKVCARPAISGISAISPSSKSPLSVKLRHAATVMHICPQRHFTKGEQSHYPDQLSQHHSSNTEMSTTGLGDIIIKIRSAIGEGWYSTSPLAVSKDVGVSCCASAASSSSPLLLV